MTFDWKNHQRNRDFGNPANALPQRKDDIPQHTVHVKNFYHAPRKAVVIEPQEDLGITDEGTYVVVWASVVRDLAALFFEGVGIVILGHFVSMTAVIMLCGLFIGIFAVRQKVRRERRQK